MDTADYIAAYKKIIPPNLTRWVMFRHGTVFVLQEQDAAESKVDPRSEAIAFLREHGPVLTGSSSADFDPIRLRDGLGWLVLYAQDGMFNYIPYGECPDPAPEVVIGLMGRERRAKDAAALEVVHVEQPENEAPSNYRMKR